MTKITITTSPAVLMAVIVTIIIIALPQTMIDRRTVFATEDKVASSTNTSGGSSSLPSVLNLTNPNTPVVLPLLKGLYDGKDVLFITTEVSDKAMRAQLGNFSGSPVNYAPNLTKSQDIGQLWVFKNGVKGSGLMGFQPNVFDSIPGDPKYTPLWKVNLVEWKTSSKPIILGSDDEISDAASKGEITSTPTNVVVNCPIVMWGGNKDNTIPPGHI